MDIITDNILRNPPVLLGLIAMFGLLVQHKPISDVIKGSLTAAFGMVILSTGVNMLLGSIAPINTAVQTSLGVSVSEGLSDASFTAEYGGTVGVTMFVALALHLAIARFTPIKTIFLTGKHALVVPIRDCGWSGGSQGIGYYVNYCGGCLIRSLLVIGAMDYTSLCLGCHRG